MKHFISALIAGLFAASAGVANAGDVQIVDAKVEANAGGAYTFSVTLKHGDEGWKHYANAWDVVAPDGTVLGKRTLHHPHVDEQPFTRSLSGVKIPTNVTTVTIRAYDSVHGVSDATIDLALPGRSSEVEPGATVKPKVVKKRKSVSKRRIVRKRKRVKAKGSVTKRKLVRKRSAIKRAKVRRKVRKARRGSY